jgi:hypothetical protein
VRKSWISGPAENVFVFACSLLADSLLFARLSASFYSILSDNYDFIARAKALSSLIKLIKLIILKLVH